MINDFDNFAVVLNILSTVWLLLEKKKIKNKNIFISFLFFCFKRKKIN